MRALIAGMLCGIGPCRTTSERRDFRSWREREKPTVISAFGRFSSLMDQGQQLDFEGDVVGCLCFLRARMVLDGSAGMRSGLVEIAVARRLAACHRIGAVIRSLPRASLQFGRPDVSGAVARARLRAVPAHGVHDDGEPPGQRDPSLSEGPSPGDRQCSFLQLECPFVGVRMTLAPS